MNAKDLKQIVKEKYGVLAGQSLRMDSTSCCGTSGCCGDSEFNMIGDEYNHVVGYFSDADLGLGCGIPTQFADITKGAHVLDLGSGAGNDCFVARTIVGETGMVTGIDFTDSMIAKANANLKNTGFKNVRFIKADIEQMPFPENTFDVVISNCVLNLVPDKEKAFAEIYRVLKPTGHFCISDIVLTGILPTKIQEAAEMYAGCVSGALQKDDYLELIHRQGFHTVSIQKEKQIEIPDSIMLKYINVQEVELYKNEKIGIYSITVKAFKNQ